MSIELLQTFSLVSFIVAALFFLIAVALFFLLRVPKLFGFFTGSSARRSIEQIKRRNAYKDEQEKLIRPGNTNTTITDEMTNSGRIIHKNTGYSVAADTQKLDTNLLLNSAQKSKISISAVEVELREKQPDNETTLLVGNNSKLACDIDTGFKVEYEIRFAGSAEIIE